MKINDTDIKLYRGVIYERAFNPQKCDVFNVKDTNFIVDISTANIFSRFDSGVFNDVFILEFKAYSTTENGLEYCLEIPIFTFSTSKCSWYDSHMIPDHVDNILITNNQLKVCQGSTEYRSHTVFDLGNLITFNKFIFGKSWMNWTQQCDYDAVMNVLDEGGV